MWVASPHSHAVSGEGLDCEQDMYVSLALLHRKQMGLLRLFKYDQVFHMHMLLLAYSASLLVYFGMAAWLVRLGLSR